MSKKIYIPERIFDGDKFLSGHGVIVDAGKVIAVMPVTDLPADSELHELPGMLLAPAYMDLQIYGGNGEMFSLYPSVKSLSATYKYCKEGGATHFMATVATNSMEIMYQAIDAVKDYWQQGLPGLLGLHLEGPYLNPAKKGAHISHFIKNPELSEVKALLEKGKEELKMMTLAPECCSDEVIRYLLDHEILVSAGHSNATYEQAMKAFNLGIPTATHLFNAMSSFKHREPGLVGALFDGAVYSSIVGDGIHVDFAALRVAKKIMGERLFLITDAITEIQSDSYTYILEKDHYVTENGILAGSCLTMGSGVKKMIKDAGILPEEALTMASRIPAQVINAENKWGRIAPGYEVDWVVLDSEFNVQEIIQL